MSFLQRLRDLDAKATPGPWDWFTSLASSEIDGGTLHIQDTKAEQMRFLTSLGNGQGFAHTVGLVPEEDSANAAIISLLRTHAARLAAVVEAADAILRRNTCAVIDPSKCVDPAEWIGVCAKEFDALSAALTALDTEP